MFSPLIFNCVTVFLVCLMLPCCPQSDSSDLGNVADINQILSPEEGDIWLTGGQIAGTGNVLLYHEGAWGSVCDDGWNLNSAHIACKMAGYPYALGHTTQAYFGAPDQDIILDDVQCRGDEVTLPDCRNGGWGYHNCERREAAGVFCAPMDMHTTTTTSTTTTTTTTPTPITRRPRRRHRPHVVRTHNNHMTRQNMESRSRNVPQTLVIEALSEAAESSQHRRGTHAQNTNTIEESPTDDTEDEANVETTDNSIVENEIKVIEDEDLLDKAEELMKDASKAKHPVHNPPEYQIRLVNGRSPTEGRLEVQLGGKWGAVCSDNWGIFEAMVVCRQTGLGYAQMAVKADSFGGQQLDKILAGVKCDGSESLLSDCWHEQVGSVVCPEAQMVAGVVCTQALPDLVPNATLLQQSAYLQDRPMIYLQCAMEENCAARSAYTIQKKLRDWQMHRRRLLRFSSSTWNFGTADFRPFLPKNHWEWHLCHMHYHSMSVFAHYDVLDLHGNRVAEGHKASFCLEDVRCLPGVEKKYACQGFADQGISVGCADDYLHDIDCQWVDITDVPPGDYKFRVNINPEFNVAELSYDNNVVTCDLQYTGFNVVVGNCVLGGI